MNLAARGPHYTPHLHAAAAAAAAVGGRKLRRTWCTPSVARSCPGEMRTPRHGRPSSFVVPGAAGLSFREKGGKTQ